jgi:hypothetical protein
MQKFISALATGLLLMYGEGVVAQECLHGATESSGEQERRTTAILAARLINTLQLQHRAQSKTFLRTNELENAAAVNIRPGANSRLTAISFRPNDDIVPGWKLTLDVAETGYWFAIQDTRDPCGFALLSNHAGVIFAAAPIR